MDTSGLDIGKLKQLAMEKWRSAAQLWPSKAMPLARLLDLERTSGGPIASVGGYFTCLRAIHGRTPEEMESLLGFTPGYYSSGVSVWRFSILPSPSQFELRGYTQLPGGNPFDGIVLRLPGASRPRFFGNQGEAISFVPGLGVEQWELRRGVLLPAVEIGRISYGERFLSR